MTFLHFLLDAVVFAVFFLGLKNITVMGVLGALHPKSEEDFASANLIANILLLILAGFIVFFGHHLTIGKKIIFLVGAFVAGSFFHSFVLKITSSFIDFDDEQSTTPGYNMLFSLASYPFVAYWIARLLTMK